MIPYSSWLRKFPHLPKNIPIGINGIRVSRMRRVLFVDRHPEAGEISSALFHPPVERWLDGFV
jgi:hypothetical protein